MSTPNGLDVFVRADCTAQYASCQQSGDKCREIPYGMEVVAHASQKRLIRCYDRIGFLLKPLTALCSANKNGSSRLEPFFVFSPYPMGFFN
jgi:hypothetical protein